VEQVLEPVPVVVAVAVAGLASRLDRLSLLLAAVVAAAEA